MKEVSLRPERDILVFTSTEGGGLHQQIFHSPLSLCHLQIMVRHYSNTNILFTIKFESFTNDGKAL